MPDMVARLKLEIDRNSLRGISGQIMDDTKKATGGGAGGIMGMLGTLPKMLTVLAGIAGGIAILTQASGLLRGVLSGIGKMILFALRPLGDILGVALMPILYILKPIGLFFNMLMRPYIQKAMAAMRAGGVLLKEGKIAEAIGAFALGGQILLKPFFDMFTMASGTIINGILELVNVLTFGAFGPAIKTTQENISNAATSIIESTTNMLDIQLGGLLSQAEILTGKSMTNIMLSLKDAEVSSGFVSDQMKEGITTPLTQAYNWIIQNWGPDFIKANENIYNKLKEIASTTVQTITPPTTYGQPIFNMPSKGITEESVRQAISGSSLIGNTINVSPTYNIGTTTGLGVDNTIRIIESHLFGSYNELKSKLGG